MDAESRSPGDQGLSFAGLTRFLGRQSSAAPAEFGPGDRLGDVTIVRLLGEGGMGRVYEGRQGTPSRTVAIKLMRSGLLSLAAARRFEHEAHILGRLTHPGIARIYSVGTEPMGGGVIPYFVMEHVEDALPITAYAARHDLSTRDRLALFREACRAIAHGHHKGIVHRDLKPGNILVDATGHPKIIDFGVARSTDGDVALTTLHTDAGQLVGTLQYMAPEQFAGTSEDLDIRADVYALGVVLYELLAGRPPYDVARRPLHEVARMVAEVDPAPLSTVDARFRGDLTTIVATCLEKDPERRYSSAAELEADLGRHLRGEAIAATPPRLVDSLVRIARRHRAAAFAAAGVAAALIVGLVGISAFAVRAEHERAAAVRERHRADSASREAVDQLYLANLRALRACVENGNLRMARQVHARNRAIVGDVRPLEMRLLGTELDAALVVLDVDRPVLALAYAPDGGLLTAVVAPPRHETAEPAIWRSFRDRPAASSPRSIRGDAAVFAVAGLHRYARLRESHDGWVAGWLATVRGPGANENGPNAPLATSPTGRLEALPTADNAIRIVDRAGDGADVVVPGSRGRIVQAAFDATGSRIAIQWASGRLALWDTSGRQITACGDADERVEWFAFSPDGGRLAVVTSRDSARAIRVRDSADGRLLATVRKVRLGITTPALPLFAFSPDGERLVTASAGNDLEVWDVTRDASLVTLPGPAAACTALAWSPDGRQIAGGATNGHIRLWAAAGPPAPRDLLGHDATITALAFRPDGDSLASGSQDGTIRVWSGSSATPLAVLPDVRGMTAAAFSPDGEVLAVAPRDSGGVELWDARAVTRMCRLPGPGGIVSQVAFSPDGAVVAAACGVPAGGGEVRVWRRDTGAPLATLGGHRRGTVTMSFSPDGARLVTACGDGSVAVWDPRIGRRCMATDPGDSIHDLAPVFGLGGERIAYASRRLLDAATGDTLAMLPPQGKVTCLAVSPDGRTLAGGMAFGSVYLDDFATGARRLPLMAHVDRVRAIAFSPDGTRLLTGSLDGTARLWDVGDGSEILAFLGHEGGVETVGFTPDGGRVLTGSMDGTARVWDVATGNELCDLPNSREFPRALALSPDGARVAAAGTSGPVRIWGLSNADVIRARQAVSARP